MHFLPKVQSPGAARNPSVDSLPTARNIFNWRGLNDANVSLCEEGEMRLRLVWQKSLQYIGSKRSVWKVLEVEAKTNIQAFWYDHDLVIKTTIPPRPAFHFFQTKVEWQKVLLLKMEVRNEKNDERITCFQCFFDSKKMATSGYCCNWEIQVMMWRWKLRLGWLWNANSKNDSKYAKVAVKEMVVEEMCSRKFDNMVQILFWGGTSMFCFASICTAQISCRIRVWGRRKRWPLECNFYHWND